MTTPVLSPWDFNNHPIFGLPLPPAVNNKSHAVNVEFLQLELAKIASKTDSDYTRSPTPPANPNIGHRWDEITSDGRPIAEWFWADFYWLSRGKPEQVVSPRTTLASGATGSTVGVSQISFGVINNANIFIESWGVSGAVVAATSATNYYSFEPRIIIGSTLNTIPGVTAKNINQALSSLNSFYVLFPNINAHYVVADGAFATGIAAAVNRFGTVPGINEFTHFLNYRYARK